jgi:photosystem II stability/assembly factor-like uncharacterized protein
MIKKTLLLITSMMMFIPAFSQWDLQYSNPSGGLYSIYFLDKNNGWAVGEKGSIIHYDGINWSVQKSNTTCNLYSVFFLDVNNGWAVGAAGTILKYNGAVWEQQYSGTTEYYIAVYFSDVNNGWASNTGGTMKWNGTKWIQQYIGIPSPWFKSIYLLDSKNGWFCNKSIYKLNDTAWINYGIKNSHAVWNLYSITFTDKDHGWIVGGNWTNNSGVILKYENDEWTEDTFGLNEVLQDVYFINNKLGWAAGDSGAIYKYNGSKWYKKTLLDYPHSKSMIRGIHFVDELHGWIINEIGDILYTDKGGDTGVSIQPESKTKIDMVNYPNPFTKETKISYSLNKGSKILLDVYDNFGRKICTLKDEYNQPGKYEVIYKPNNLSPGIYHYILQTDFGCKSGRMVLMN